MGIVAKGPRDCSKRTEAPGRIPGVNFRELCKGEVPRIPLPRTPVNTLPVNAPNPSGWHHAHGIDPLETNASWLGEEEEVLVSQAEEKNKALIRRFLGGPRRGKPGRTRGAARPRLRRSYPTSRPRARARGLHSATRSGSCR